MMTSSNGTVNDWTNTRDAVDLRLHRAHYEVIVLAAVPAKSLRKVVLRLAQGYPTKYWWNVYSYLSHLDT